MSYFKQYKIVSRKIRTRYNHDTNQVVLSREDFEELAHEAKVSCEQAQQLQTIIENLQEIKAGAVTKALDEIRAEIKDNGDEWIKGQDPEWHTYDRCLYIIDKHRSGSEVEK